MSEVKPPIIHAEGCATNLGIIGAKCNCGAEAQRDTDVEWFRVERNQAELEGYKRGSEQARLSTAREIRQIALQAIANELEYPSEMPDELWQQMNGNREVTQTVMRNTVRLTKNGITDRFLQALKSRYEEKK